eukprot:923234-Pleurochrysis_carterae.AAC.1
MPAHPFLHLLNPAESEGTAYRIERLDTGDFTTSAASQFATLDEVIARVRLQPPSVAPVRLSIAAKVSQHCGGVTADQEREVATQYQSKHARPPRGPARFPTKSLLCVCVFLGMGAPRAGAEAARPHRRAALADGAGDVAAARGAGSKPLLARCT